MPKVSVIMTSYNLSTYIEKAIESVLSQTFTDFELLIGDDASTDDSLEKIKSFSDPRIRVYTSETNQGPNANANRLLKEARGEYIAHMSSDDVWLEHKLKQQVAFLDANADIGMVFGFPIFIDAEENLLSKPELEKPGNAPKNVWRKVFYGGNCLHITTSMYRSSLHNELGLLQEDLRLLADLDWYVRVTENHEIHVLQTPLTKVRVRGSDNLSSPTTANLERHHKELNQIRQTRYKEKTMKLMIATPFYEIKGYSPYIISLVQTIYTLAKHTTMDFEFQELSGGSYIDNNRNVMADKFLRSDCTHLMFIDSDQSWDVQGFMNILKADVDMVGAAYPVKNNWEHYGVSIYTNEDGTPLVNEDGLIKAEKVPTGFMKISRKVFETIRDANPDDWYYHGENEKLHNFFGHLTIDHVRYGEDISFNIRWQRCGGEIWLEPKVAMGHFGSNGWFGNYHEYLMRLPGGAMEGK